MRVPITTFIYTYLHLYTLFTQIYTYIYINIHFPFPLGYTCNKIYFNTSTQKLICMNDHT